MAVTGAELTHESGVGVPITGAELMHESGVGVPVTCAELKHGSGASLRPGFIPERAGLSTALVGFAIFAVYSTIPILRNEVSYLRCTIVVVRQCGRPWCTSNREQVPELFVCTLHVS